MFVYILQSKKDGTLYVGSANNVAERLLQHNRSQSSATKGKRPWILVGAEEYDKVSVALKRERFFKTGKGKQVIKNLYLNK
jgi:putative endonuclease